MKLTKKMLKNLINEVISEFTTTQSGTGTPSIQQALARWNQAKDDHIAHQETESDYLPKKHDVPDKTKWVHPYSQKTTLLGKGETQPSLGWQYRQSKTTPEIVVDDTKWIHPYKAKDTGTAIPKGTKKPETGWTYEQMPSDYRQMTHPFSGLKSEPSFKALNQDKWTDINRLDYKTVKDLEKGYADYQKAFKTVELSPPGTVKSPNQPAKGWMWSEPVKKGQVPNLKNREYGEGSLGAYERAGAKKHPKGWELSKAEDFTNPFNKEGKRTLKYASGTKLQQRAAADAKAAEKAGQTNFTLPKETKFAEKTINRTTYQSPVYGKGEKTDYQRAQEDSTIDMLKQAKYTTNPEKQVANPEWTQWASKNTELAQTVSATHDAYQQAVADAHAASQAGGSSDDPPPAPTGGGTTSSGFGRGKSAGKGRGKGRSKGRFRASKGRGKGRSWGWKGKGRSKGRSLKGSGFGKKSSSFKAKSRSVGTKGKKGKGKKKKEESLFRILGRDFLNEMKNIKKYTK